MDIDHTSLIDYKITDLLLQFVRLLLGHKAIGVVEVPVDNQLGLILPLIDLLLRRLVETIAPVVILGVLGPEKMGK